MSTDTNTDYRAAHRAVTGLKVTVTGLAALAALVLVARVWSEAVNDQDGFMDVFSQGVLATVLVAVMVGLGWGVLMLPLWLIAGFTRRS